MVTEIVDAGVDWITATCSDQIHGQNLLTRAAVWMMAEKHSGSEQVPWARYGYQGFQCGAVELGSRDDGVVVRLSGPTAWKHWDTVAQTATHISRLDLQMTVRTSRNGSRQISAHYKAAMRAKAQKKIARAVSLFRSDDGSATLYLGKRTSDMFCRIYEKGKESKLDHYKDAIRYEVELKNEQAHQNAKRMLAHGDQRSFAIAFCAGYLAEARCCPSGLGEVPLSSIRAPTLRGDAQTCLEWLRRQVGPSIASMIECGRLNEVAHALGYPVVDGVIHVGPRRSNET
jgi:DNA relaxase NicK